MPRNETLRIAQALREESALAAAFPVPSAGIHPGLVPKLIKDFGTDCIINAGGGVHGHPHGAIGGGKAFRQAVDAVLNGITLEEAASQHKELKSALDLWGVE